jgi:cation transport regulator ChaC
MLYFAYGSNMLTERLKARVPSAVPRTRARLPGYRLQFHKRSQDGSGKCDIVATSDGESDVHGVLFEVEPQDLTALDEAEHRGRGYERSTVQPRRDERSFEAFAYVAQPAYTDDALVPYAWYHALVLAGAHQHGLPESYRTHLTTVRTYPDPNGERRTQHRSLLRASGYLDLWPDA